MAHWRAKLISNIAETEKTALLETSLQLQISYQIRILSSNPNWQIDKTKTFVYLQNQVYLCLRRLLKYFRHDSFLGEFNQDYPV